MGPVSLPAAAAAGLSAPLRRALTFSGDVGAKADAVTTAGGSADGTAGGAAGGSGASIRCALTRCTFCSAAVKKVLQKDRFGWFPETRARWRQKFLNDELPALHATGACTKAIKVRPRMPRYLAVRALW